MDDNKIQLAKFLTLFGSMPFVGLAVLVILGIDIAAIDEVAFLVTYGAIIASFISGIHWGVFLFKDAHLNLFLNSNVVAMLAWVAVILGGGAGILVVLVCLFYLLWIDWQLFSSSIIDQWYVRLRIQGTFLSVISLLAAFFALLF